MSAIVAEVRDDGGPTRPAADAMLERLRAWALDGSGVWSGEGASLGLGLARFVPEEEAPRPLVGASGWVLAFDGRVDAREELAERVDCARTACDSELVLCVIERWGPAGLRHVIGEFAIAAWLPRERRLLLARDRFGERPLYYARTPHGLRAASSMSALFVDDAIHARPNREQLALRLNWEYSELDETLLEGVHAVPPATSIVFSPKGEQRAAFWRHDVERTPFTRDPREATRGLGEVLERAVRDRLRSRRGVGIQVSGGVDSSTVAAVAAKHAPSPPPLFTFRFGDLGCDETLFSDRVAAHLHAALHPIGLPAFEALGPQPDRDVLHDPLVPLTGTLVRRAQSVGVDVLLNGWGADELTWRTPFEVERALSLGRPWLAAAYAGFHDSPLSAKAWRRLAVGVARTVYTSALRERLGRPRWGVRADFYPYCSDDGRRRIEAARRRLRAQRSYPARDRTAHELVGDVLTGAPYVMASRAVMYSRLGISSRAPFFDLRVVERTLSIPREVLTAPDRTKPLLRDLADGLLPPSVAHRTVPWTEFNGFYERALGAYAGSKLAEGRLERLGLIAPGGLARALEAWQHDGTGLSLLMHAASAENWLRSWGFAP